MSTNKIGTFREWLREKEINEGKKFHPIDVFGDRYVITDGKHIFGQNGEVVTIKEYKTRMKNLKIYDSYDDIFYPTEELAKNDLKKAHDNFDGWKVVRMNWRD